MTPDLTHPKAGRVPGVRDILGRIGGGLMAVAFASALGWLIASEAPSHSFPPPTWPYWLCGGMFVAGALIFAGARGWLSQLVSTVKKPPVGVSFVDPQIDGGRLSLVVVNTGRPAEFKAQVLSFTDEHGRQLTSKTPWTIPWSEPGAPATRQIAQRERGILDFARFDWPALNKAIQTTKWGNDYHWFFGSTGGPVEIAYSPVESWAKIHDLRFTAKVRMIRVEPPAHDDTTFEIGYDGNEIVCERQARG